MKKIIIMLFLVVSLNVVAQEVIPYAMTKQNASITYAVLRGEKKKLNFGICYYKIAVNSATTNDDGSKTVVYRTDFLNKKKKITNLSKSVGSDGGFFNQVVFAPDGSYVMDQDILYGYGGEMARGGFMFKVPETLSVGQTLESGTVNQKYVMMRQDVTTSIAYNNVKVEREEDYVTPAGTFHCYVITFTISGVANNMKINEPVTLWMAPGFGIICYKSISDGRPIYMELHEYEGIEK